MNEPLLLILAWAGGVMLGGIFFGGLWWTVRQGVASPRPAVWFLASLLLRMAVVLEGFYLIGHGDWKRLVAALAGLVAARVAVMYVTRSAIVPLPEGSHAT